ncbi:hypothetical protein DENSPDRAFT_842810 [Dentipellis sp. KUC8613]|nr:hypothetical protein DENSPDRAFT_842810 [Dentipellis sp. KUC8613]
MTLPTSSAPVYSLSAEERLFTQPHNQPHRSWSDHAADVRRVLNLEIDATVAQLCSLRTHYNSVAHVNRLPTELLAHIFGFVQEIDKPGYNLGWLRVTHVCHQWRSAALGHSNLWAEILYSLGSRWAFEFLNRSQMAPISFTYCADPFTREEPGLHPVDMIRQHLCHMRKLDVIVCHGPHEDLISSLRGPAPLLEEAKINNYSHSHVFTFPEDLFANTAPRLRYLDISRFNVPWSSLNFANLLHLRIDMRTVFPERDDFGQFFSAFSRLLALEVLELHDVVSRFLSSPSPASGTDPVTLPKLRRLTLEDRVVGCIAILKHLAIDSTVDVDMECHFETTSEDALDGLLSWLTSYVDGRRITPKLMIETWPHGFAIVVPLGFTARAVQTGEERPHREAGEYGFRWCLKQLLPEYVVAVLDRTCQRLPGFERLEVFTTAGGCAQLDTKGWFSIFGRCHQLRRLEVQFPFGSNDSLWTALQANKDPNGEGHIGPLFPALTSVLFSGREYQVKYNYEGQKIVMWTRLRMKLAPLQTIELAGCTVDRETMNRLGDEVPRVVRSRKGAGETF